MSDELSKTSENKVMRNEKGQLLPGVVLNPAGKPRGARHMSTILLEAIKKVAEGDAEPADILIVRKLVDKAKKGEDRAILEVFDRLDGKAPQSVDITTDGERLPAAGDVDVEALAAAMAEKLKESKT